MLRLDKLKLVEDEEGEREEGQAGVEAAQEWRLEMQESRESHPEWNDPEMRFMRVEGD